MIPRSKNRQELTRVQLMEICAELVKLLGDSENDQGISTRDYLCLDGVSLWEIVEPTLAAFELPRAIDSEKNFIEKLKYKIRSYVIKIRYQTRRSREVKSYAPLTPARDSENLKVDAIFFGFSGYMERDIISPFLRHLDNGKIKYAVLGDNETCNTANVDLLAKERINIWSLWDAECNHILDNLQKMYWGLLKGGDRASLLESITCNRLGISKSTATSFIQYVFQSLIPHYFHHLVIAKKIYGSGGVRWNISPDVSDPKIRAFCLVGKQLSVKWADIQFGIYGKESTEWNFCSSDYVAAWGPSSAKLLKEFQVREEIVHVTGSPKFDGLINRYSEVANCSCNEHEKINVLFCSMYALKAYLNIPGFEDALDKVKQDIIEFSGKNSRINLIIKLHPLEDSAKIIANIALYNNIKIVEGAADIREYIKKCDVFITLGSTSTMDALLLSKPIIFPNYDGLVWWDDVYLKSSVVISAPSSKKLENIIRNLSDIVKSYDSTEIAHNSKLFTEERILFSNISSSETILLQCGLLDEGSLGLSN